MRSAATICEASDADFLALLDGRAPEDLRLPEGTFEDPAVLSMLRELANTIRPAFSPASWKIVERGEIVGLCSLVKAPVDGSIEIGYGVTQSRRGQGHASKAVHALVTWARQDPRVTLCKAETSVKNEPSQRVLQNSGFVRAGTRTDDEDGDLICWSLPVAQ